MSFLAAHLPPSSSWGTETIFATIDAYGMEGGAFAADSFPSPPAALQHGLRSVPDSHNPSSQDTALAFCKGIDRIQVRGTTRRDGRSLYNVHLFIKKAHSFQPQDSSNVGDIVLQRRFSFFVALRHETHFHAHSGHGSSSACGFCSRMAQLLDDEPMTPRQHNKLHLGEAAICQALEGCLSTILALTNTLPLGTAGPLCDGQETIPSLLYKFLTNADSIK